MPRSNKIVALILILGFLLIVILSAMAGPEWKRAYTDPQGNRYYYDTGSVSEGIDGGSANYFEMRVYRSGSNEFDQIKEIVKHMKTELVSEDIGKDYLYKEIQAEIDCQNNTVKFKHTDYIAVGDTHIWSDIHEPEKWQDIETDSMKAIKEAVCK
jgi:hypothetical protein